jgi:hypothetical protein
MWQGSTMSIHLNLPEQLESELAAEAQRLGLPLDEYVLRLVAAGRAKGPLLTTGAELVAYWQEQGVVGSRVEILDSQEHARKLRAQAERRARN